MPGAHRARSSAPWGRLTLLTVGGVASALLAAAAAPNLLQSGLLERSVAASVGLPAPAGPGAITAAAAPRVLPLAPSAAAPVKQEPEVLEDCRPDHWDEKAFLEFTGAAGAGALGAAGLGCSGDVASALPPTALESSDPDMLYALVTRDVPVKPRRYAPKDLKAVQGGPYEVRKEVAVQLERLIEAAAAEGHDSLVVTSGFRAYEVQEGTHQDWVRRTGEQRARMISALPGHSEHQLGLAVDLTGSCGGFECFGRSDEGRWVAANAHRWGFIVRYPKGGEEVTGYAWEPWHLRYVGPRAAWQMYLDGEEYWEDVQPALTGTA